MYEINVTTRKGTKVSKVRLSDNECYVGKAKDNLIILHGWKIGKIHAKLFSENDGLYIADNNTKIGTTVNDNIVKKYGPIKKEDVIAIGDYCIRVRSNNDISSLTNENSVEVNKVSNNDINAMASKLSVTSSNNNEPIQNTIKIDESILETERWRKLIHQGLFKLMDLRRADTSKMDDDKLRLFTKNAISEVLKKVEGFPENLDKEVIARQVLNEAVGLGPLEELIEREDISEIMVNAYNEIFYECNGKIMKSDVTFTDDESVMSAIERIVSPLGRRIDESSPLVDARLKDGSRVNAVIPPLALKGPCISIRKFMKERLLAEHLVGFGSVSQPMVKFLETIVLRKRNVVISGGTGSGKTTLLNVLSNFIPDGERIVTVEDAAELKLYQPNLVSLEARPPNQEGKGAITIRNLVKNCLRMRPDRIVVGECRGGEALDMLQAMNTGHDGSLTTVHSNSPRDCVSRLEVLVLMSGMDLPVAAIREQISSAVNMIVQQTRFSCGSRRVTSIAEVTGVEAGTVQIAEIFKFQQDGYDADGKIRGRFLATGIIPEFYEDLVKRGIDVDLSIFTNPEDK